MSVTSSSIFSLVFLWQLITVPVVEAGVSFAREIQPILSKNCLACHGADEHDRKAGLRLDTYEGATTDNKGVVGIVPMEPDKSEILKRMMSQDPDEVMPPPDHGHALAPEAIALVKQWIAEGARYEKHWSFSKPRRPEVPAIAPSGGVGREIDHFITAKLTEQGLVGSPAAEPHELLRRVALDLTGLPPSWEAARAFAADPSEAHFEKQVDGFLASPKFGEHWASMWLDLARYADSVGYSGDEHRDIWPWRDWVIAAFNQNMPFDRFTIEQLAGDLLPQATDDQRLATAFHRNTLANNEGGTNDEEFRVIAVKDRINTTVNVWMGLTMRCAECHTHKYDPISQKEYYQFYDFFNQTVDADNKDDRPKLEIQPRGREKERAIYAEEIKSLEKRQEQQPDPWIVPEPLAVSRDGTTLTVLKDRSIEATGENPPHDRYTTTIKVPGGKITGIRMEVLPSLENAGNTGRAGDGASVITRARLSVKTPAGDVPVKLQEVIADYQQVNAEAKHLILQDENEKGWAMNHDRDGYRARREVVFALEKPLELSGATELVVVIQHDSQWKTLNTARYRLAYTSVERPVEKYKQNTLDPVQRRMRELVKLSGEPVRVPVLREREDRRKSQIMAGGSFRNLGEQVTGAVPVAFHPFPAESPQNRLGVAQWIVSRDNPLTARVTVNRFWARLFGMGIVETEEDFGLMGLPPAHPELLDWLAVEFMESRWDVKALLKKMVMSATYRQSSRATAEHLAKDVRNVYLARGPRTRLAAEVIRDQALAISGLQTEKTYGPPVYPPSPVKHIASAFTGGMTWKEDTDEDRYRRAVYTYLKRSSPHPLFDTFDMATRDVCSMRRLRTNTPLQSFMGLNDPVFIEAAQSLARAMLLAAPGDTVEAIRYGLEKALMRPAPEAQLKTLKTLYDDTLTSYQADLAAARKMAGEGKFPSPVVVEPANAAPLAALSVVANVILNLDSFLTK